MRRCRRAGWRVHHLVAPLAVVLFAVACADDDSEASPPTDTALQFSETPIRLGFVNTERGILPVPAFRFGAEVAVEAINAGGGVNGSPVELVQCAVDGTPETSTRCAEELVADDVSAVVVGFDVGADAMLPVLAAAGVPFVGVNSTGPAQRTDPAATILHSAPGAFDLAPFTWFARSGPATVGVVVPDDQVGRRYVAEVVDAVAERRLGLTVTEAFVDPIRPDFVAALETLVDAGVDAVHAELDDLGCLGLVDAARRVEIAAVSTGDCRLHLELASAVAVGTVAAVDVYTPLARDAAPRVIAERLDRFVEAMTAAGHARSIGGFSASTYGAMFELAEILRRAEVPVTASSVAAALDEPVDTPGWLGPDLHCGEAPFPDQPTHCRADVAVVGVSDADGDGQVELDLVADFTAPLDDLE